MATSRKGKGKAKKDDNLIQEVEDDNSSTISRIYRSLSLKYNMNRSSDLSGISQNIVCAQARMTFWAVFHSGKSFTKLSNDELVNTAISYLKKHKGIKNPQLLYSRAGKTQDSKEKLKDSLYNIVTQLRFQYLVYIPKVFNKIQSTQRRTGYSGSDSDSEVDSDY